MAKSGIGILGAGWVAGDEQLATIPASRQTLAVIHKALDRGLFISSSPKRRGSASA